MPENQFLTVLNKKLSAVEKQNYYRPANNSFMSAPEWRNVEMAEEFARFLRDDHSLFQYPYFSQIFDLWKIFFNSYRSARRHNTDVELLTSEYMIMDAFVVFFTTLEFAPKGILSLLFKPLLDAENKTEMQTQLATYFAKYAADLQTIPFYDHHYAENRAALADAYRNSKNKSWCDWFSWKFISAELYFRRWVSMPLHAFFHVDGNTTPSTTDVLVQCVIENATDVAHAKTLFREKIVDLNEITLIENHLYVEELQIKKTVYALLRVHRYAAFMEDVKALDARGIVIKKIATQDQVQVKCECEDEAVLEVLKKDLPASTFLYSHGDRLNPKRRICFFEVPVEKLQQSVKEINSHTHAKVTFIHNF